MRDAVLADQDTARLWWPHRNLTGDNPATPWQVFLRVQARPVPVARGEGQAVGSAGSAGAVRQMT
jgi:hypothetical protein